MTKDKQPKWKTCRHAIGVGNIAVYVTPNCRNLHMMHGTLVSTKRACERCCLWEAKDEGNEAR